MMNEPTKYTKYEVQSLLKISDSDEFAMERIFSVYKNIGAKHFYYNILRKINFPEEFNKELYTYYKVKPNDLWPNIAYKTTGSISLWWLIAVMNGIDNTFIPPNPGTMLKVPTKIAVRTIIDNIKKQI